METNKERNSQGAALGQYRPTLRFYHANQKGTGGALELKLHPAHDNVDGSIMMRVANQCAIGDRRGASPTFARFDWANAICVKLDFNDLCRILQVFRGECESINDDRGLYHQTSRAATKIQLRHLVEPITGYSLEVYRNSKSGGADASSHIILSSSEAYGIFTALEHSIAFICFGVPGAYGAAGVKNVSAA